MPAITSFQFRGRHYFSNDGIGLGLGVASGLKNVLDPAVKVLVIQPPGYILYAAKKANGIFVACKLAELGRLSDGLLVLAFLYTDDDSERH